MGTEAAGCPGAQAVKTAALFFHEQDLQSRSQEEHQLVPYAG
jgi:hypothetical protein